MSATDWIHDLKVADLKEELKKRGLPVSGKKAELAERLETFVQANEAEAEADKEPSPEQGSEDKGDDAPAAEEAAAPAEAAPEPEPAAEEEAAPEEPAAVPEPAAEAAKPAAQQEEPAAAEAEAEAAPAEEEPAAAEEAAPAATPEEPQREPSPAAAQQEEEAAPAAAEAMEEEAPAAAAAAKPAAAAEPATAAAAKAPEPAAAEAEEAHGGVEELDYGESDHEDAAAAKAAEAGRKREREDRGAAGGGSAERPTKVVRRSSGLGAAGQAEAGERPAPEDVPAAEEPATRALRIDNLVRPFTEGQLRSMLNGYGFVKALWMPSIKTHCYAVFENKAQAEAARKGTWHVQWPATSPKRLEPRFVALREAEAAIGKGSGNPDFKVARTEEDGPEEEAAEEEAAPAAAEAAAAAGGSGREGSAGVEALDKRLVERRRSREWNRDRPAEADAAPAAGGAGAGGSSGAEGVRDLREMLSSRRSAGRELEKAGSARNVLDRLEPAAKRPAREPSPEPMQLSLDDLFRKTHAKPCIYWLPRTEEQVAEKKKKAAAAAADKAGGGDKAAAANGAGPSGERR